MPGCSNPECIKLLYPHSLTGNCHETSMTSEHTTFDSIMGCYMQQGPLNKLGGPCLDFLETVRYLRATGVLFPAALLVLEAAAAGTGVVTTDLADGDRFRFHHGTLGKIPAPDAANAVAGAMIPITVASALMTSSFYFVL